FSVPCGCCIRPEFFTSTARQPDRRGEWNIRVRAVSICARERSGGRPHTRRRGEGARMPHDLFGDALVQQPRSPLRRLLAVLSIALHAVLVTVIFTAQVLAPGPLPPLRPPMIYEQVRTILVAEIPIPPARRSPGRSLAQRVN